MTTLSFAERVFVEIFVIILLVGVLETLVAPYLGFVKPAVGSGVMPLSLLIYALLRYSLHWVNLYRVSQHS